MMPLGLLSPGEQGEIVKIRLQEKITCCGAACGTSCCSSREKDGVRMEDLGLRVGKIVQMLTNGSPVLLRVDESRIAVDRGLAMKIMVRRAA